MYLNPELLAGELVMALLLLCWAFVVVRAALRTSNLPVCWKCGCAKVRRSHSKSVSAFLLSVGFLKSYRCRGCRVHFYGFDTQRRLAESAGYRVYSEPVPTR